MEDNFGEWVESMGVDILIIIINIPYSTCIRSFLAAASLLLCSFLNVFGLVSVIFLQYIANVTQCVPPYCV